MAQTDSTERVSGLDSSGEQAVRAQLAVEPHSESSCAILNGDSGQEVRSHNLKTPTPCLDGGCASGDSDPSSCSECHTVVSDERGDSEYLKSSVHEKCICPVFENHDCIPEIQRVSGRSVIVTLTIRDREEFTELITDLREVGAEISVEWLVTDTPGNKTAEIDVSAITTKQREAMRTAIDLGYYETPRSADLEEVATELSISESAVSQRLNNAETKLVTSFLGESQS